MIRRQSNPDEQAGTILAELRQTSLNLLARREHSVLELRHKLMRRGFPLPLVEAVLERLVAEDLLSDSRYAEVYANTRIDKGYGPLRVDRELRERGVSDDAIAAILKDLEDFWVKKLVQVHRKRFGGVKPTDMAEQVRQMRFLRHRGFTIDQIKNLFRRE